MKLLIISNLVVALVAFVAGLLVGRKNPQKVNLVATQGAKAVDTVETAVKKL